METQGASFQGPPLPAFIWQHPLYTNNCLQALTWSDKSARCLTETAREHLEESSLLFRSSCSSLMEQLCAVLQRPAALSQLWINHQPYFINKAKLTILPTWPCFCFPAEPQKRVPHCSAQAKPRGCASQDLGWEAGASCQQKKSLSEAWETAADERAGFQERRLPGTAAAASAIPREGKLLCCRLREGAWLETQNSDTAHPGVCPPVCLSICLYLRKK